MEHFAAYVSGAEGVSDWMWRKHPSGVEMRHGSVLAACGKKTRGWQEAEKAAALRQRLEPILSDYHPAPASCALVRSFANGMEMLEVESLPHLNYYQELQQHHRAIYANGNFCDVLYGNDPRSLEAYALVSTPLIPHLEDGCPPKRTSCNSTQPP